MSGEHVANLRFVRFRHALEELRCRQQDPGCAEPALKRMVTAKCRLQIRQFALGATETFHGLHRPTFHRDSKRETGSLCNSVDAHGAGAAYSMLAADVHADGPELLPQEIRQEHARLAISDAIDSVDGQLDPASSAQGEPFQSRNLSINLRPNVRT